ncbi:OmpA family protein [Simkania negevensis]|uniref:Peptidoglycan-associated lipoprotein n=1 Tax=Simkania negevensis (strain ATCC VR-1471 / DSM 27360 / Z) TaxID=331113 RepID=F8L4L0_SIMNZ|nr:OmpA family protein [Simkania negevensis]MCB1066931.1 OmpA family protein [Simkania sp.]MCB1074697.1 OmpA family protein [Simkania sp.]MCP5490950.1 OmpA family protein [Chlamydiales bacterium]CCB88002.1 peptidoglycan-associated lipoprotein [Simkania negevensis Z]
MKKSSFYFFSSLLTACYLLTGCQNSSGAAWEDTKTMGRYIQRQGKLLWRKDVDSRMIETADDFQGPTEEEFIPLKDEDLKAQFANFNIPQPAESPGVEGSSIPSIEHFSTPQADLAELFKNVYFNTDEHVLRKKEFYAVVDRIADYMKKNPNVYIFVSGHCDERASEAYNLALGTRRANTLRSLLVKKGVNPNHIYTISFGKEMPADLGHSPEAWSKNRRVEFKIFKKE